MAKDHRGREVHAGKRTDDENVDFGHVGDLIPMHDFDYRKWQEHEQTILKPRLEEKGYTGVGFKMGESDSFGPLMRIVHMTDEKGRRGSAWYG
jgi:hypothetical protein